MAGKGAGICQFFLKGHCRNGDSCPQEHPQGKGGSKRPGAADPKGGKGIGKGDTSRTPGKRGQGGGKGTPGNTQQNNPSTPKLPCFAYAAGNCDGTVCDNGKRYAHRKLTPEEEKERQKYLAKRSASPAPSDTSTGSTKKPVCQSWYEKGTCNLGDKCPGRHPNKLKGKAKAKAKAKATAA